MSIYVFSYISGFGVNFIDYVINFMPIKKSESISFFGVVEVLKD